MNTEQKPYETTAEWHGGFIHVERYDDAFGVSQVFTHGGPGGRGGIFPLDYITGTGPDARALAEHNAKVHAEARGHCPVFTQIK